MVTIPFRTCKQLQTFTALQFLLDQITPLAADGPDLDLFHECELTEEGSQTVIVHVVDLHGYDEFLGIGLREGWTRRGTRTRIRWETTQTQKEASEVRQQQQTKC